MSDAKTELVKDHLKTLDFANQVCGKVNEALEMESKSREAFKGLFNLICDHIDQTGDKTLLAKVKTFLSTIEE